MCPHFAGHRLIQHLTVCLLVTSADNLSKRVMPLFEAAVYKVYLFKQKEIENTLNAVSVSVLIIKDH